MQKPAKAKSVNAEGIDMTAFRTLAEFLPGDLRAFAETTIAKAIDFYECDRHYEAVAAVDAVLARCKQQSAALHEAPALDGIDPQPSTATNSSGPASAEALPTPLAVAIFQRFLETSVLYTFALSRTAACDSLTREIDDNEGWKLVSDHGNGDGTYYRYDDTNDAHFFKVRGTVDMNVLYICSIIMELDLFSEWFPNCRSSVAQGEVSRYYRAAYMLVSVPWPFSSRDVMMLGAGIDDLEERNRIVIVAHSIPFKGMAPRPFVASPASPQGGRSLNAGGEVPPGITVPVHNDSNVVCDIIYTGFEVKMCSPTQTRLSFMLAVDPKVPNIPQGVLNWMSGKVMWGMLGCMAGAAKKAMRKDSKYYQRRRERPDVYGLLRQRYNDMLRTKFTPEDYAKYALPEDY